MLSCGAASAHTIAAFCWRITRHNTLAALANLNPQWLVRDLLPLPPSGGIPRGATRSLSTPSSAHAAGQGCGPVVAALRDRHKAATVAGLKTAAGDRNGSNWHFHPRRRWLIHRHNQD